MTITGLSYRTLEQDTEFLKLMKVCDACGVVFIDKEAHRRWHDVIANARS